MTTPAPPSTARATTASACPICCSRNTKVVCTRPTIDDTATVRRRRCLACDHRWYAIQVPETIIPDWAVTWSNSRPRKQGRRGGSDRITVLPITTAA